MCAGVCVCGLLTSFHLWHCSFGQAWRARSHIHTIGLPLAMQPPLWRLAFLPFPPLFSCHFPPSPLVRYSYLDCNRVLTLIAQARQSASQASPLPHRARTTSRSIARSLSHSPHVPRLRARRPRSCTSAQGSIPLSCISSRSSTLALPAPRVKTPTRARYSCSPRSTSLPSTVRGESRTFSLTFSSLCF